MAYTHSTFAQLKTELAGRLGDAGKIYWADAELGLCLQEALRTWQALTSAWRDRMTFNTLVNTSWYDLTQQTGTLIPYTQMDSDLVSVMLYHLLEPQLSAGLYVGSEMFTLADFTKALERRRNQFLVETGMVTGLSVVSPPPPPDNRVSLADSVIDVRRASWKNTAGKYTKLWKTDEHAAASFHSGWSNAAENPPLAYSVFASPPLVLTLIPPPLDVGSVELISVSSGQSLDPSTGVLLGIPDDFAWVVKWGALADLLARDGESKDVQRAGYCEARWQEGIAAARIFTSVLVAYIDAVQKIPGSVFALDAYRPTWQNDTGTPDAVGLMSWNLIALSKRESSLIHSVQLDVVRNAPVPTLDTDKVQIGREELDAILDYSQHLASFKQAGQELEASIPKYQNFVRLAKVRNERLKSAIPFYELFSDRATVEEKENTRRTSVEVET